MKTLFHILNTILFLYSIAFSKEDICGQGQISISGLGKCISIKDLLETRDLKLKTQNLLYLASNNEGKIKKDGYKLEIYKLSDLKLQSHNMRKSKLYIPNSCMKKLETNPDIFLDKSKGIVIMVYDSNNLNDNNITDNYFIIRHNSKNSSINYINSKDFDFSFCHEDPILFEDELQIQNIKYANANNAIDIDKILYARKNGIDLFNRYSSFFDNICIKFKSERGTDVTLESRVEDYFQNITLCDDKENSHYMAYNYSSDTGIFTYRCAFGYYKNEEDKSSYIDKIDAGLKSFVDVSNFKVINCYKQFLNLRDIIKNYGGMICIFVLLIQIVCFLIFCFCGIKPIKEKLDDLFILGKVIIRRLSILPGGHIQEGGSLFNINLSEKLGRKVNLWGQIKKLRERRLLKERQEREKKEKKKRLKLKGNNPPNKKRRRSSISKMQINKEEANIENGAPNQEREEVKFNIIDVNNEDENNKNNNLKDTQKNNLKVPTQKNEGENNTDNTGDSSKTKISHMAKDNINIKDIKKDKKKSKKKDDDRKSTDSQLYEYDDEELNVLPLKKAVEKDNRSFCKYYRNILLFSHIILNVFFRHNDYNLFVVKLGLLFMTFPINLTMNIFFFTNKEIQLNYVRSLDDISMFWSNIDNTVYSSILSMTLLIILKLICLTHNSVRGLRKMKNVNKAEEKSVCILRCIKVRIAIYYVLSFAFLVIFGFYVLCFCAIFENTQIDLIKSTLTSWLMSLVYPFIICFFTSAIRMAALHWENRVLYGINKIMQFL